MAAAGALRTRFEGEAMTTLSCRRIAKRAMALLALLGGLAAGASAQPGIDPNDVPDFGHYDSFPAVVDDYVRAGVHAYAPDLSDFSIGYDSRTPALTNVVTLYFYPRRLDKTAQARDEERQVLQAHPGGRVVDRRSVTLTHGTQVREASLVTYAFDGDFAGLRQTLASQQLLVFRDKGIFMVRSTAPSVQGEAAERAMLALVQQVDWESVPDR
jgi:hypothetical protein